MKNENTIGAEAYVIHPAIARALTADGYDLGKIVSAVKAQKGRSTVKDVSEKASDVKLKEATESRNGESSFTVHEKKTYVNDLSAPMRFAAFTDGLASVFKKHGEPSAEITSAIVPAHLVVWLVNFKTDEQNKVDKATAGKPAKNGRHVAPAEMENA